MIILNRKRITLIITSLILSFFVFFFTIDKTNNQKEYVSTVSLPVSEKVIVVDAGHGKPDERSGKFKRNYRS